jgi:hypothetical protein
VFLPAPPTLREEVVPVGAEQGEGEDGRGYDEDSDPLLAAQAGGPGRAGLAIWDHGYSWPGRML